MLCLIGPRETRKVRESEAMRLQHDLRPWSTPAVVPPVHVSPHPQESFESLMFRVVERNALESVSVALQALGAHCPRPSRYCYQHLSSVLGIEPSSLAPMLPTTIDGDLSILGHQLLRDHHLVRHASRICPLCVSERGYGALEWTLAPFAVCADHGVYLVDRCACRPKALLNVYRPGYATCICGADLRNAVVSPASNEAYVLAKEVRRRFRQDRGAQFNSMFPMLATWPEDAQFGDFLDLVICLGSLVRGARALSRDHSHAVYRLERVAVQFESAAHVLSKWRGDIASAIHIASTSVPGSQAISDEKLQVFQARAERYLSPSVYRWLTRGCS